jgi:hypothetical protein
VGFEKIKAAQKERQAQRLLIQQKKELANKSIENCPLNLRIKYSDGEKGCLTDLPLSKSMDKSWGKPISEVVRSASAYAIAASDICEEVKVGVASLGVFGSKDIAERNALGSCSKDCACKIIIYSGQVQLTKSTTSLYGDTEDLKQVLSLQRLLDDMSDKKVKFTLAMIDACRDNPFKVSGRSIGGGARGLAPTTAATGQMVVFSAGTGQQALDKLGPNDKDKNGLFTRVFIKQMQKPGITIDQLIRDVRTEVVNKAKAIGHDQVPAIYDQVVGNFYFRQ